MPRKAPNMKTGEPATYEGWDDGKFDRAGFGLGQFQDPVSEAMPNKAKKPLEGPKQKVRK